MNNELREIYVRNKELIDGMYHECAESMQGPFLVAPSASYWNSKVRVVFVGQETRGWSCEEGIDEQMKAYEDFNLGKNYYSSPFWNVIRKLERQIVGEEYSSAWLNMNRYDENGAAPSRKNREILSKADFIVLEELQVLAPHVAVFMTGPSYDQRVSRLLDGSSHAVSDRLMRQVCEISSPKLGALIVRTYHPHYLRRSGLEKGMLEVIAELAKSRLRG